jgi:hypothetical protein
VVFITYSAHQVIAFEEPFFGFGGDLFSVATYAQLVIAMGDKIW